jgi:hypothetical protein
MHVHTVIHFSLDASMRSQTTAPAIFLAILQSRTTAPAIFLTILQIQTTAPANLRIVSLERPAPRHVHRRVLSIRRRVRPA